MHNTATTSREHYKTYDASGLHALIKAKMRENAHRDWCIADMAEATNIDKSTISARMNELREYGELEYTGKKPSETTGIVSNHYKLIAQPSLL